VTRKRPAKAHHKKGPKPKRRAENVLARAARVTRKRPAKAHHKKGPKPKRRAENVLAKAPRAARRRPNLFAAAAGLEGLPPEEKPLTGKQALFVRAYTSPGEALFNGTRAAEIAGYGGDAPVLAGIAYENLRKPHIARAVQAELARSFTASNLTVERVLRDVELVRQLAIRDGRYQAALRASDLHGKFLKMWVSKIEHLHTIEDASNEQLLELLGALLKQVDGINLARLIAGDGPAASGVPDPARAPTAH
jgi:hypothetical protein